MTRLPRILGLALCIAATCAAAQAETYAARDGGPSHAEMIGRGHAPAEGLAFVRPVLSGVLFGPGSRAATARAPG